MASISTDRRTGLRRILFVAPDGKRKAIRLGKISIRNAETFRLRIEALLNAKMGGYEVDRDTVSWTGQLNDKIRMRLEQIGLLEPQERRECQEDDRPPQPER